MLGVSARHVCRELRAGKGVTGVLGTPVTTPLALQHPQGGCRHASLAGNIAPGMWWVLWRAGVAGCIVPVWFLGATTGWGPGFHTSASISKLGH